MSEIKQKFGSFTAHAILKELRGQNRDELLAYFHQKALESKEMKNHKIWENIQAKNVYSQEFLIQKLEYIHNNPIQPRWQLVETRALWKYSSACFYDEDKIPIIPISDVRTI